ncbi:MAG TPA: nuclear transport factor 2 family protein [Gemmatimonadaceae bacterium]|nr:nuclear transport factor 2 family protein [Gemmatimonadaceae bacterium]
MLRSFFLVAAIAALACSKRDASAPAPDIHALQAGVDSAANRLLVALRTNNSDSLMALMADDIIIMPPGESPLKGKAAVKTWYDGFLTQLRTTDLTVSDREVVLGDDEATEIAGFEWKMNPVAGGQQVVDRGSYMQLWKRAADGRWLFSREVWNSSAPPVPPAK